MVNAAVRSVVAAVMSAAAAQLLAALLMPSAAAAGEVDGGDGDARRAGFVQRDRQVGAGRAVEQVDAVEARVAGELVDLGLDRVELRGEARADRRVGGLLRLAERAPAPDCTSLVIEVMPLLAAWMVLTPFDIEFEQVAQVAGAVRQALRGEEVDRIVERGVDPLAGGKLGLGGGDQVGGLLQLQKVRTDARGKNDISHGRVPFWSYPHHGMTRDDPHWIGDVVIARPA